MGRENVGDVSGTQQARNDMKRALDIQYSKFSKNKDKKDNATVQ